MSEKKETKKAAAASGTTHLYVESIKEGPISALDVKTGHRIDLFKGLNKIAKKAWEVCKPLPMIKAYLDAGTLKERTDIACADPVKKADPNEVHAKMEKAQKANEIVPPKETIVDESMTVDQITKKAEELGYVVPSNMLKAELIEAVNKGTLDKAE